MIEVNRLPDVLQQWLKAQAEFNSQAYAETFDDAAIVDDESRAYEGKAAIKAWNEETNRKYRVKLDPLGFREEAPGAYVLTISMSGTFDGSPATADFHFTTGNNKIKSLTVK